MTKICKQCGAINNERELRCCFCDTLLATYLEIADAHRRSAPIEGNLAVAPDWRREIANRLEAYRARRRCLRPDHSQTALPFSEASTAEPEAVSAGTPVLPPSRNAELLELAEHGRALPIRIERVEIAIAQPELASADANVPSAAQIRRTASDAPLVPVAELADRKMAGLLDAGFVLLSYGGFLGLFAALGGQFSFGKSEALVYAAALVLFYAQYFALFTVFGGPTPGMLLRELRVVSFDGTPATHGQLLWRSFGYIVSGGTAFLGFLWALWDEDRLTWHDRISQTYITHSERAAESEPLSSTP